jgi:GT2 family glycosyltransferase
MQSLKPLCSVVIVSYNNFHETTGPCLKSLQCANGELEIIVVDNNSNDVTKDALRLAGTEDPRIHIIFNKRNSGYAGANNLGAEQAGSPFLLLLNSDTEVLPNTITRLLKQMERLPELAMLGPVSNQTGNDQQIYTSATEPAEILAQGAEWCKQRCGSPFLTDILSFCCVLIRTDVYKQLQGLDESFGLGYYEDTDFNYRAAKAGLQLAITEDSFVYHRGSGSFSKTSATVRKMVKQNKALFRKKHGHGILAKHWRVKNADALKRYLASPLSGTTSEAIRYRFTNRYSLALQLYPNSPFKKLRYYLRLRKIRQHFKRLYNQDIKPLP